MSRKIRAAVFLLLAVGIWVFIFSNSAQGSAESNAVSGRVAEFLRPLLNPNGWIEEELYLKLVRKLAHFVEFGALGVCLSGAAVNLGVGWPWPFGISVLTACADETLQSFTGRTNSLKDVLIDSAGAACGVLFVYILCRILKRYRERRTWVNSDL